MSFIFAFPGAATFSAASTQEGGGVSAAGKGWQTTVLNTALNLCSTNDSRKTGYMYYDEDDDDDDDDYDDLQSFIEASVFVSLSFRWSTW